MSKIIGATELQRRFRTVFDDVVKRHNPQVVTRGGQPDAALVPYDQFPRIPPSSSPNLESITAVLPELILSSSHESPRSPQIELSAPAWYTAFKREEP